MGIFLIIFLVGTALNFVVNLILEAINSRFRKKYAKVVPSEVSEYIDLETVEKTCLYKEEKYNLWLVECTIDLILLVYLVLSGFFPSISFFITSRTENIYFFAILFVLLASVPGTILGLPFDFYSEFSIEKRYGFSKMTKIMWVTDLIKSSIINFVISSLLLSVMIFVVVHFANYWWLVFAAVYLVFSLGLGVIYPIFIAPIFNKFTPLEEGELKTRLENLLKKCGFKSSGLFVMDASKRSGHSNAYFTGFGKSKRVVLYDTLIEQMTPQEIEAVLAHELGHYKHHHIAKRFVVLIPLVFAVLYAVSILLKIPQLYSDFGFTGAEFVGQENVVVGVFLLMLETAGIGIILSPLANYFSRKNEFQADAFSKELCQTGEHLINALIKLNKENLSQLDVPKIYSIFNYSHPPLLERIKALKGED